MLLNFATGNNRIVCQVYSSAHCLDQLMCCPGALGNARPTLHVRIGCTHVYLLFCCAMAIGNDGSILYTDSPESTYYLVIILIQLSG